MSLENIFSILKEAGLPVTYAEFPPNEVPPLPYVVFIESDSVTFKADNYVYSYESVYDVELYSHSKDIDSEQKIINVLNDHERVWEKTFEGRTEEDLYEVIYTI